MSKEELNENDLNFHMDNIRKSEDRGKEATRNYELKHDPNIVARRDKDEPGIHLEETQFRIEDTSGGVGVPQGKPD
ncbi:hypothetical protein F6R98_11305 [Candidatus Methylospira mobilis]|uniref:Uncharacterized protein n=1 Tax=Candidatus Methylospira mobilis TaxID=1808979 RepID=A0A5Q0BGZ1_9GAMM|nr:hypothetical protein [Candidatus Methylospira mobilis]QFY43135.1 hypothetical protein F6R98_11305 [Candidatus Methylospira mobilis]